MSGKRARRNRDAGSKGAQKIRRWWRKIAPYVQRIILLDLVAHACEDEATEWLRQERMSAARARMLFSNMALVGHLLAPERRY